MSLLTDKHRRGPTPTIMAMQVPTNGETTRVYVFEKDDKDLHVENMHQRYEVFYCLSSMMAVFSFGIMLGWPSPIYPQLLDPIYTKYPFNPLGNFSIPSDPDAPLQGPLMITLVQSPLIVGLLMIGVIVATPFSSHTYTIYSIKHGLLVSLLAMTLGWILIWQASNIYHLLVSRFIIGLGNGFAVGQIKVYIQYTTLHPKMKAIMGKMINIITICGIMCAYTMGIWLNYEGFALGALAITFCFYVMTCFMPLGELGDSKIQIIGVPREQNGIVNSPAQNQGLWALFTTPQLKKSTWLLVVLTFVQQFSGAPATIVYSQILLLCMGIPADEAAAWALVYLLTYLASYILGIFYFCTFSYPKKRLVLIFSIVASILALVLIILTISLDLRDVYLYLPLIAMCFYIFCYGIGLGSIPNTYVDHLFDSQWKHSAGELQILCFSLFAVIITKLLQVFLGEFPLEYAFVLHACVATAGLPFVLFCLPRKSLH